MMKLAVLCALASIASAVFGPPDAVVGLVPGGNKKITGTIYFSSQFYGVLITGTVKGLSPGLHGFHVHEVGDTSDSCAAAGGHFNPLKRTHGGPKDFQRHAGDLGNILADKDGVAHFSILDNHISLHSKSPTYIGKLAVVIHAGVDDLGKGGDEGSLTSGNAGGRDGCGIIQVVDLPKQTHPLPASSHHQSPSHHSSGSQHGFYRPRYYYK